MELVDPSPEQKNAAVKMGRVVQTAPGVSPSVGVGPANDGSATLLIIKELSAQLPSILNQIKDVKKTVPPSNPVQEGLEEAVIEISKNLTLQILNENPEMLANLKAMLKESLAVSLMEPRQ